MRLTESQSPTAIRARAILNNLDVLTRGHDDPTALALDSLVARICVSESEASLRILRTLQLEVISARGIGTAELDAYPAVTAALTGVGE